MRETRVPGMLNSKYTETMRAQDYLADTILGSRDNFFRYMVGFEEEDRVRAAPGLPNHAAWCMGHCALVMHRIAEKLGAGGLPDADFLVGAERGDSRRYGTESVAFGSSPSVESGVFPTLVRCREIFSNAAEHLAGAIRSLSEDQLNATVQFFPKYAAPAWHIVARMAFHNGFHAGQIADLRRALGMKSIFA